MDETLLLIDEFEGTLVPVVYGTGKNYGDGWLYGGIYDQNWIRPYFSADDFNFQEIFEHGQWFPPTWSASLSLSENFEDGSWIRPTWSADDFDFQEIYEGLWV